MTFKLIISEEGEETVVVTVHKPSKLTDQIEALVRSFDGDDTIIGYCEDEIKILSFNDIECVYLEGGKTYAVLTDSSRYKLKIRLYEAEKLLSTSFIKLNKSALGNIERIEKFTSTITGAVDVVFKCGHTEYVSRRCFANIKRRLLK